MVNLRQRAPVKHTSPTHMPVVATLLFGSLARADQSERSDTDLLMISLGDETHHVSIGHLSLFLYPWHTLENNARDGDLFVCHLVYEAKPLLDPDGYLLKLKEAFRFRSNYMTEIAHATDLGWYLVKYGDELNSFLQAKRTLWCLRTILIARSAERRAPVFAPHLLAKQTRSVAGRDLLTRRHNTRDDTEVRQSLRLFLEAETTFDPFNEQADRTAFMERFKATSNKVALETLRQEEQSQAGYC